MLKLILILLMFVLQVPAVTKPVTVAHVFKDQHRIESITKVDSFRRRKKSTPLWGAFKVQGKFVVKTIK